MLGCVSLLLLSSVVNHQCFREAWLCLSIIYHLIYSRDASMRSPPLNPRRLMTECDAAERRECAHSWHLNKRDSVVEALDRANGSNNGALFQICCLSHRPPLTRQCRCCSARYSTLTHILCNWMCRFTHTYCMLGLSGLVIAPWLRLEGLTAKREATTQTKWCRS